MDVFTLFMLAAGLSMDAFAAAVCKGLALEKLSVRHMLAAGGWFGGFQALMPLAGYGLGVRFKEKIVFVDHWIAFVLLGVIGVDMIRDACTGAEKEGEADGSFSWRAMLFLALATSMDALAAGVTFAFLEVNILTAVSFIGAVTFLFAMAGVKAGYVFGGRYKAKAELAGGGILIFLGVKILLEHMFF